MFLMQADFLFHIFCRLGATCVCVFSFLPAESKLFVFHDFQENKMTFLFRGNFLIKNGVQNHLKKWNVQRWSGNTRQKVGIMKRGIYGLVK